MKEEHPLLIRAKTEYPFGTVYQKTPETGRQLVQKELEYLSELDQITDGCGSSVYVDGKWSNIISTPDLVTLAKSGEISIENDSTVDDIRDAIMHIWPDSEYEPKGDTLYYQACKDKSMQWVAVDQSDLPVVSVRAILHQIKVPVSDKSNKALFTEQDMMSFAKFARNYVTPRDIKKSLEKWKDRESNESIQDK